MTADAAGTFRDCYVALSVATYVSPMQNERYLKCATIAVLSGVCVLPTTVGTNTRCLTPHPPPPVPPDFECDTFPAVSYWCTRAVHLVGLRMPTYRTPVRDEVRTAVVS